MTATAPDVTTTDMLYSGISALRAFRETSAVSSSVLRTSTKTRSPTSCVGECFRSVLRSTNPTPRMKTELEIEISRQQDPRFSIRW